jgi:hypothetical protein
VYPVEHSVKYTFFSSIPTSSIVLTSTVAHHKLKLPGSSGGSVVVIPDCETAVLGSNPAISPAYSRLPVLRWAAILDGTLL